MSKLKLRVGKNDLKPCLDVLTIDLMNDDVIDVKTPFLPVGLFSVRGVSLENGFLGSSGASLVRNIDIFSSLFGVAVAVASEQMKMFLPEISSFILVENGKIDMSKPFCDKMTVKEKLLRGGQTIVYLSIIRYL